MSEKEKSVSVLVSMPESLRDDFKKVLTRTGSSMSSVIRILMAEYIEKNERLVEKKPKKIIKRNNKVGE